MEYKYNIFISYARKDFDEVNALFEKLKAEVKGIKIWFDINGVESGDEFEEKIISAIDNSEVVLFALSDNSINSKYAKDEVVYAKNTNKRVIPVLLKGAQLKGWFLFKFGRIDCITISDNLQWNKLIENLCQWFRLERQSNIICDNSQRESPIKTYSQETTAHNKEIESNLINQKYRITLVDPGQAMLSMVKTVKEVTGWDLKHSKDFVDSVPSEFPILFTPEEMIAVKQSITDCGGVVRVDVVSLVGKPSYVDLGLSVKWAKCNLGASKPEEYGGYYQWAGTEDVSDKSVNLDLDNCPYHTGSNRESGWTKYNTKPSYGTFDNKTTLEASDDAATVNLGGKWRMPTNAEWTELIDNCTWTWTTLKRVKGYKVQSKKPGYTDNWIFLPAADKSSGHYWSSSLNTDFPSYAYSVLFYSGGVERLSYNRYYDYSVRPVSE